MVIELLQAAFGKVERQTGNKSDNGRASHLEFELRENYKTSVSAKSLVRYLKGESTPKRDVLNKISEYLDYNNYEDYVKKYNHPIGTPRGKGKGLAGNLKYKKIGIAFMTLMVGNLAYLGLVKEEEGCMVWVNDHYEKSECKGQVLEFKLNVTELQSFKKISVCDTVTFFNKYDPVVWYDKFNNKIEYFTYYGRNPLNGRTLRPITKTIIDKYVKPCDNLEKL